MSDLKVLGIFHVTKGSLMKLLWIITSNLKQIHAACNRQYSCTDHNEFVKEILLYWLTKCWRWPSFMKRLKCWKMWKINFRRYKMK